MVRQSYENILELIQINESIKHQCQKNLIEIERFLLKQGRPKGYSSATSYVDADRIRGTKEDLGAHELQLLIENLDRLKTIVVKQDEILTDLYAVKRDIDEKLAGLTGLHYEVGYLKLVKGKSLVQIADDLHISVGHAKRISAKI